MTGSDSLYEACRELFSSYPKAVRAVDSRCTVWSIVIMLQEGAYEGFYVLSQDHGKDVPVYSLWPWPAGDIVKIVDGGDAAASGMVEDVVRHGVPIPRDGSVFGWASGGVVAALIVIYAESAPVSAEPGWSVMPLVGVSEARWPPFTGERLFGNWSWGQCRSGSIISLDEVIAETPEAIWWVDTKGAFGSDCCVVSRDITSHEGCALRRGRYVYYQALRAGETIPSLEALLSEFGKIDLAPGFQCYKGCEMVATQCST